MKQLWTQAAWTQAGQNTTQKPSLQELDRANPTQHPQHHHTKTNWTHHTQHLTGRVDRVVPIEAGVAG